MYRTSIGASIGAVETVDAVEVMAWCRERAKAL